MTWFHIHSCDHCTMSSYDIINDIINDSFLSFCFLQQDTEELLMFGILPCDWLWAVMGGILPCDWLREAMGGVRPAVDQWTRLYIKNVYISEFIFIMWRENFGHFNMISEMFPWKPGTVMWHHVCLIIQSAIRSPVSSQSAHRCVSFVLQSWLCHCTWTRHLPVPRWSSGSAPPHTCQSVLAQVSTVTLRSHSNMVSLHSSRWCSTKGEGLKHQRAFHWMKYLWSGFCQKHKTINPPEHPGKCQPMRREWVFKEDMPFL